MPEPRPAASPCPCGRQDAHGSRGLPAAYSDCCGRWHDGPLQLQAPDAQALMRSRYSAYVLQRADYLLATWHASTRPATIDFEPGLRWLGLDVRRHASTGPDSAVVEFVARSKLGGRAHRLHETSHFVREAGRWFYLEGKTDRDGP
ncbi:YchJ family protein [Aquabacterium sp.]|uniref:YchJ family protein n=1 Tax=Aquabacterium sp. TaxID=1872578 RepID=UPI002BB45B5D|nr:YchJ family metal-binding protein [Aquabacterium sp.]HSW08991.1 YchJ family metal-binding protein [Aquabacterium sp.]